MEKFKIIFDGNFFIARSQHQVDWSKNCKKFSNEEDQNKFITKISIDLCSIYKIFESYSDGIIFTKDHKSWRKSYYEEYKANRIKNSDEYDNVAKGITENNFVDVLKSNGNVIYQKIKGAEADDIIAMWKYYLKTKNQNLFVISADKDLHQLADDNCMIYNPIANKDGFRKLTMNYNTRLTLSDHFLDITKKNQISINVVDPLESLFVKMVWGDKGDNIPNMKAGVGEKTSQKIFNTLNSKYNLDLNKVITESSYNDFLKDLSICLRLSIEDTLKVYQRNLKLICLHPKIIDISVAKSILADIKNVKFINNNSMLSNHRSLLENTGYLSEDRAPKNYDPFANLNI